MIEFVEERFFGPDDSVLPEDLPPGFVESCQNVHVVGGRGGKGGEFKSRPGKVAQLSSAFGSPFYESFPFVRSNGSLCALIATGSADHGRIRIWEEGGTSTTQLTDLGEFNAPEVQFARVGDFVYISGNVDGKLRRTDLDPSSPVYETAEGLTKPTRTISATLRNNSLTYLPAVTPLERFADDANWDSDSVDSGNTTEDLTITDYNFAATTTGIANPPGTDLEDSTGWTVAGTGVVETADTVDPGSAGDKYVRLDEPGSAVITKDGVEITNAGRDNGHYTPPSPGVDFRFANAFLVGFRYKSDVGAADSIIVSVIACDGSGNPITQVDKVFSTSVSGSIVYAKLFFSFGSLLSDTQIEKIKLVFTAGPNNIPGGFGPYFSFVTAEAVVALPNLGETETGLDIGYDSLAVTVGAFASATVFDSSIIYCGQNRLSLDLGTGQDWDQKTRIALPVAFHQDGVEESIRLRLGFRETINGATETTDDLTLHTLPNGQKYFATDLSPLTDGALDAVLYVDLIFMADIELPEGAIYSGAPFMTIGPLVEAGNLSVDAAPYRWRYRERRDDGTDHIKSPASEGSGYLYPTDLQAQASLVISNTVPENAEPGSLNIVIEWFRQGGENSDGFWYKVAEHDADSSAADSSGKWSWNHTTRTFIDNVGDIDLLNADTLLDHVAPPSNVLAIGTHNGDRLVLGTAEGVWISQASLGVEAGLYYNSVNNAASGDIPLQGWFQPLSGGENAAAGKVTSIVGVDDRSLVLYKNVPHGLAGTTPLDFDLRAIRLRKDLGPISHRAVDLFDGAVWFLGVNGLNALSISGLDVTAGSHASHSVVSGGIEKRLNPGALYDGTPLNAAAYAESSLFVAGDRLFLSAPAPGSTAIDRTYVWDAKVGKWFPWLLGAVTGGFAFNADGDANDTYITTSGGQIFKLGPRYGDDSVKDGAVSAVAVQIVSRRYESGGLEVFAEYLSTLFECSTAPAITFTVEGDPDRSGVAGRTATVSYTGDAGETILSLAEVDGAHGRTVRWTFDATTTNPISLRWVRLEATTGRNL